MNAQIHRRILNMEISSSVVLPVTAVQMAAFSIWIVLTYGTYDAYMSAIKDPAMDTYIKENLLPDEMKTVMRRSEQFRGEKYGDIHIRQLLLNRRRVTAKMKNLKEKVGKLTFPNEAARTRTANRVAATGRRLAREADIVRENQMRAEYDAAYVASFNATYPMHLMQQQQQPVKIVKVHLCEEDEDADMEDDCVICMINHKKADSCIVNNCGHQFGSKCLKKWTGRCGGSATATCPLCRTTITEMTEFTYDGMYDAM